MTWKARLKGIVTVTALAGFAALAVGARCIENVSLQTDSEGYRHLVGEMYNDTEVQGTGIVVKGTLLDAAGNVIAEKQAPLCPPVSHPHSQGVFDIKFDQLGLPQPASWSVRVVDGRTQASPLPDPNVLVLKTIAAWWGEDVIFAWQLRNRSQTPYTGLQGCAAVYNNAGQVVDADVGPFGTLTEDGEWIPGGVLVTTTSMVFYWLMEDVSPDAALVRGWLWFEGPAGTSGYQFSMTPKITIQPDIGAMRSALKAW